jgi:hypothetical protein
LTDDATRTPWGSYEKAKAERGELPPLEIKGETFTFPASPPAELVMNILEMSKDGKINNDDAAKLIVNLIGEDKATKLAAVTTWEEFSGILNDLLIQYGIAAEKEGEGGEGRPNRQARRASGSKSSKGSARSKPTSAATTG